MANLIPDFNDVLSTRHLVTTGIVVGAMLSIDPVVSWFEGVVSPSFAVKLQTNKYYKTAVAAVAVLGAQVLADKLLA